MINSQQDVVKGEKNDDFRCILPVVFIIYRQKMGKNKKSRITLKTPKNGLKIK